MANGASQFMIEPGTGETFDERAHISKVGGVLWITGGLVALGATFLPGSEHKAIGWILVLVAFVLAYGVGTLTGLIPWPSLRALAIGTALTMPVIGVAIYITGGSISYVEPLLICALLYSALFFPPRWAWPLVVELLAIAGAPLLYEGSSVDSAFPARYVARVVAFLTVTWVILALKQRLVDAEARQREIANRDALTGVPNRRAFDTTLRSELAARGAGHGGGRRDADRQPLALMLVDLDDFKGINDAHGHQIGDAVLRLATERVQAILRSTDVLARIGGDEFAVIAPGAQGENAEAMAETIRDALAEQVPASEIPAPHASIGHAVYPEDGETFEQLMRAADQRLLRRKERNGNGFPARGRDSLRLL